jgi:hypothetical protein
MTFLPEIGILSASPSQHTFFVHVVCHTERFT